MSANVSTNQTVCATAEVRTDGSATGGARFTTLLLLGGSGDDQGNYWFQNFSNGEDWEQIGTCITAKPAMTSASSSTGEFVRSRRWPDVWRELAVR
jgi:hypothetical protein